MPKDNAPASEDGEESASETSSATSSVIKRAPPPRARRSPHRNAPRECFRSPRQRATLATASRARSRLAGGRRARRVHDKFLVEFEKKEETLKKEETGGGRSPKSPDGGAPPSADNV